jgi:hypothetical protein
MADENEGTTSEGDEAQEPVTEPVTPPKDEVTTLRSRNAGLDAKVTSLTQAEKAAKARADAAEAKLADYEAGKVGADEALRAQLQASQAETAQARQEANLARIEAKYPETFSVLGEAAIGMSDDKLAEAEARFRGVESEGTTPTKPIGNNPNRNTAAAAKADESGDDIEAKLRSMAVPW